eukprot:g2683.t1
MDGKEGVDDKKPTEPAESEALLQELTKKFNALEPELKTLNEELDKQEMKLGSVKRSVKTDQHYNNEAFESLKEKNEEHEDKFTECKHTFHDLGIELDKAVEKLESESEVSDEAKNKFDECQTANDNLFELLKELEKKVYGQRKELQTLKDEKKVALKKKASEHVENHIKNSESYVVKLGEIDIESSCYRKRAEAHIKKSPTVGESEEDTATFQLTFYHLYDDKTIEPTSSFDLIQKTLENTHVYGLPAQSAEGFRDEIKFKELSCDNHPQNECEDAYENSDSKLLITLTRKSSYNFKAIPDDKEFHVYFVSNGEEDSGVDGVSGSGKSRFKEKNGGNNDDGGDAAADDDGDDGADDASVAGDAAAAAADDDGAAADDDADAPKPSEEEKCVEGNCIDAECFHTKGNKLEFKVLKVEYCSPTSSGCIGTGEEKGGNAADGAAGAAADDGAAGAAADDGAAGAAADDGAAGAAADDGAAGAAADDGAAGAAADDGAVDETQHSEEEKCVEGNCMHAAYKNMVVLYAENDTNDAEAAKFSFTPNLKSFAKWSNYILFTKEEAQTKDLPMLAQVSLVDKVEDIQGVCESKETILTPNYIPEDWKTLGIVSACASLNEEEPSNGEKPLVIYLNVEEHLLDIYQRIHEDDTELKTLTVDSSFKLDLTNPESPAIPGSAMEACVR